jgi:PAS domain-containing protein
MEDVDDRKKMEGALRASEALLKAVFDAVPVGIVIAEAPSGRILGSNPQAEAIFRRSIARPERFTPTDGHFNPRSIPWRAPFSPVSQPGRKS